MWKRTISSMSECFYVETKKCVCGLPASTLGLMFLCTGANAVLRVCACACYQYFTLAFVQLCKKYKAVQFIHVWSLFTFKGKTTILLCYHPTWTLIKYSLPPFKQVTHSYTCPPVLYKSSQHKASGQWGKHTKCCMSCHTTPSPLTSCCLTVNNRKLGSTVFFVILSMFFILCACVYPQAILVLPFVLHLSAVDMRTFPVPMETKHQPDIKWLISQWGGDRDKHTSPVANPPTIKKGSLCPIWQMLGCKVRGQTHLQNTSLWQNKWLLIGNL